MALRFHLDEHVSPAVAKGLRHRGIDVTTTLEAGLMGAKDKEHLAHAVREKRVLFSYDPDFLGHAKQGSEHWGIVFCESGSRSIGQIIEWLVLMDACLTTEEMHNQIEFI